MKVDGNATVSLVLDPKQDDATNCNSSCYVKYISGAVVASIKKNASNEFSNFEKKCFLRSNRSSTLAQVKSVCKNTVNCIINFNQNTFPLTVFAINETDNTQKYKSPDSLITAQPYSSSPSLKFKTSTDPSVSATNITISQASPKTLKDLEVQIPDCNEKYLVVQYIYAKTENPLFKENQVKRLYKLILELLINRTFT